MSDIFNTIRVQTTYTDDEIRAKLVQHNNDEIKIIREYMGLPLEKAKAPVKSVNQEIFRQIRHNLDDSMRQFREKNPVDVEFASSNMSSDTTETTKPLYCTILE